MLIFFHGDTMYSVSQVIEQLLVTNNKSKEEDSETICECSIGSLKYNTITDQKFETEKNCSKKAVCYFVSVEKHKARISEREFLRHQNFNAQRMNSQLAKAPALKDEKRNGPKSLLNFFE